MYIDYCYACSVPAIILIYRYTYTQTYYYSWSHGSSVSAGLSVGGSLSPGLRAGLIELFLALRTPDNQFMCLLTFSVLFSEKGEILAPGS